MTEFLFLGEEGFKGVVHPLICHSSHRHVIQYIIYILIFMFVSCFDPYGSHWPPKLNFVWVSIISILGELTLPMFMIR